MSAEFPAKDDDTSRDEREFGRPQESAPRGDEDEAEQPPLPGTDPDEVRRANGDDEE